MSDTSKQTQETKEEAKKPAPKKTARKKKAEKIYLPKNKFIHVKGKGAVARKDFTQEDLETIKKHVESFGKKFSDVLNDHFEEVKQ